MFMHFFSELRQARVPVTLREYLMLMEALDQGVIDRSVDDFYYLSRSALVKDETPAQATLHFPGGLSDFLASAIEGRSQVVPAAYAGEADFPDAAGRCANQGTAGTARQAANQRPQQRAGAGTFRRGYGETLVGLM